MFQLYIPSTFPYLIVLAFLLGAIFLLLKNAGKNVVSYLVAFVGYAIIAIGAALMLRMDGFDFLRMLTLGAFAGGFLLFAMFAWFAARSHHKVLSKVFIGWSVLIIVMATDAFLIEPHALEVDHATIKSAKIKHPIKMAILSDLQLEKVTDYERGVIKKIMDQKPDIILFPGDYVQADGSGARVNNREIEIHRLNEMLKEMKLAAPLGVYAVHGNVEDDLWGRTFEGLPVTCFLATETVQTGPLQITGLTLEDSFEQHFKIEHSDKFHIVFGHGPDFALGNADADLLVAGHTHGGQVQIPFYGPPITMCRAPTAWARGCITEIHPGTTLIVSRGVGMERNYAPRMRILCHPQIIFVDLVPATGAPETR